MSLRWDIRDDINAFTMASVIKSAKKGKITMPLKKKILLLLMFIASCVFMYQGFSLLFHEKEKTQLSK